MGATSRPSMNGNPVGKGGGEGGRRPQVTETAYFQRFLVQRMCAIVAVNVAASPGCRTTPLPYENRRASGTSSLADARAVSTASICCARGRSMLHTGTGNLTTADFLVGRI